MKYNPLTLRSLSIVTALLVQGSLGARAADRYWSGGTGTYNNAAKWTGGVVPGAADNAINDSGLANVVQLNVGDPDWGLSVLRAGNGAFEQNGQTLSITNALRAFRLGVGSGSSSVYTLNGGALNYGGEFAVGELGQATLNIRGGSIAGNGTFSVNLASGVDAVNATMDDGPAKTGHTWFERGFYTADITRGLPAAGSTFTHESLTDHSYTMAPSYAGNCAVMVNSAVTSAAIALTTPTACSGLSFLGSAGNGAVTINYTVHHADTTTETGSFVVPDWYDNNATIALRVGGRVRATGFDFQNVDNAIDYPRLYSIDINLANTASAVTSIDLAYVSGGVAGLMAISGNSGTGFAALATTSYNADLVLEAAAALYVSPTVTDTVTQTAGTVNVGGEFWVGNYGAGRYDLSEGTLTVRQWMVTGRMGGRGTFNMTGGTVTKFNNNNGDYNHMIIGAGPGPGAIGTFNQSGGTINDQREYWVAEGGCIGTNNISGTAALNLDSWTAIGRGGPNGSTPAALGVLNFSGGTIHKTSVDGHFIVADWGTGFFNQTGGTFNDDRELWVGQGGTAVGTYNLSAGTLNVHDWVAIGRDGGNGTFNMTGGSFTKDGNGDFLVAAGNNSIGVLNHSAGTITSQKAFLVPQWGNSATLGTYNVSDTAVAILNDWVAVGRDGGSGILNLSGGSITKGGGGAFIVGASGLGTMYQTGGSLVNTANDTWLGENNYGTWSLSGGTATLGYFQVARNGGSTGTMNLDGGILTANEIAGGGGNSTFVFNGGKLVAGNSSPNFIHGLTSAYVAAGGAIIDTAGFDVAVNQILLDNGGGLTKNGAGTLTLNGANNYVGATTVNAGKLATTTASIGGGSFDVAGTAALGVQVAADNGQLAAASVSFAGPVNTLDMDLSAFGSPAAAPLSISGALNVSGTVTVNILASSALQLGVYPLITAGSRSGGSFALGTLPLNTVANLVDNGTTVSLNVTSVNAPRWEGLAGGDWDIGLTTNWINGGSGEPTYFSEGSEVVFNDEAQGTTSVNLVATVHPTTVTFNNNNLSYTLSGSGKISGVTGLSKQGNGTLAIANMNDYTGSTVISGGAVSVTNLANTGSASSIGKGNLVLAGGTLSYAGPATAINRGYSVQANSSLDVQGDLALSGAATAAPNTGLTKTGPAQLTYTTVGSNYLSAGGSAGYLVRDGAVRFDGAAGPQTNIVQGGRLGIGEVGGLASVTITNSVVDASDIYLGDAPDTIGSLTIDKGSTVTSRSWFILGNSPNTVSTVTLNDGTVNVPNGRLFLCAAPNTTATLNINGGVINKSSGDVICISDGGWGGASARTGIVNQVGGTVTIGPEVQIGQWADSHGIWNLHGGDISSTGWFVVGRDGGNGTFNIDGGTFTHTSGGQPAFIVGSGAGNNSRTSVGVLNHSGGTINCTSEYWVAENTATVGTNNISGTAVVNIGNWMSIGRGGLGVVNFLGGTITKTGGGHFIIGDGGTGLFTQSGGSLSINNEFWIGQGGSGNGTFNLSAGTVTVGSWVAVGRAGATGVWNMSGGSFTKTGDNGNHFIVGSGGPATLNQTGGTITSVLSDTWVAENSDGIWNLDGGDAVLSVLHIAQNSGRVGVFNLNATGTLTATEVTTGNGSSSTLNIDGGTLKAGNGANANFLHGLTAVNVLSRGATIDSGTNVVGVDQALLDGTGGGGLTVVGNGTVRLNGANTYTGTTAVNAGALGGSGSIAGPLTVAAAGTLAPGNAVGTLTVNNSATLGGTTLMEVTRNGGVASSDRLVVTGNLAFGGTLKVVLGGTNPLAIGDTFDLFDWGTKSGSFAAFNLPAGYVWDTTQLSVNGTIRVTGLTPPQVNPPTVVGGQLVMTGVGGPAGASYTWLSSTNVAAPAANWTTNSTGVFDSTGSYSNAFLINPSEPARFFRLKTP